MPKATKAGRSARRIALRSPRRDFQCRLLHRHRLRHPQHQRASRRLDGAGGLGEWLLVGSTIGSVYKRAQEYDVSDDYGDESGARRHRRDLVVDLLSRRRSGRPRLLRIRHSRPRAARDVRGSLSTCCGIAGCRRAPSSAICSRRWRRRGRCPNRSCASCARCPPDQPDGRAQNAHVRPRSLRSRRPRQLAAGQRAQGDPTHRADSARSSRRLAG